VQPHTWDAFQLLALEDCSGEEVAGRLRMPLSSVYVARHNVHKMLREEMQLLLGE
jgi:DNA-directed RNA polymerase specialized sigma24 family protein